MSTKKQRESLHWFLNVALRRRVVSSLSNDGPVSDIMAVAKHAFTPSVPDCDALEKNMIFHILRVATNYVDCLKPYEAYLPKCIDHPHIEETSKKQNSSLLTLTRAKTKPMK